MEPLARWFGGRILCIGEVLNQYIPRLLTDVYIIEGKTFHRPGITSALFCAGEGNAEYHQVAIRCWNTVKAESRCAPPHGGI